MDKTGILLIGLLLIITVYLMVYLLVQRRKTERLMDRLDRMVDAAVDGNLQEEYFDESRLSSFEARFFQYLRMQAGRDKKQTEEQKKIHGLLADISHQTKTPIANLVLYAQLLEEQIQEEESRDLVRQLNRQAEKLQFLITALIKSSRLDQGIIQPVPGGHSVNELLIQIVEMGEPAAEQKQICMTLQTETATDTAYFDPRWTAEALWNILDNGIKYTYPGDTIILRGSAYELFYRIDIINHGIRIPDEEIPKIFKRFYRSGQTEGDGVGLGLYLAREIIRAQGGYIKVTSKEETIFSVFLPRQSENGKRNV